jgi:transcriptional regulator with XRE-family HTH domain
MQNSVTDAVRRLRVALGDTQQQFAARTGLAISTVVRYELSRPPKGDALEQFKSLAEKNCFHDIARTFAYAMGQPPETAAVHAVVDSLWWNREKLKGWPMLAHHLSNEMESLVELKRRQPDSIAESIENLETQLVFLRSMLFGKTIDQINEATAKFAAEHPEFSWSKAYERALKENPNLYTQYLRERAEAARGTHAEESLSVPSPQNKQGKPNRKRRPKP